MNPLVRLVLALLLGIGWLIVMRAYAPESKIQQQNPEGRIFRRDINNAMRAMAFFALTWAIASTVVFFLLALVIALVAPVDPRGFWESFTQTLNSSADNLNGVLAPQNLWGAIANFIATVFAVWYTQRVTRFSNLVNLGLRPYKELPADVVFALVLGTLLFAIIFSVQNALGFIQAAPGPTFDWLGIAQGVLICLCVAVGEELVVRGFFMQVINEVWGGAAAVVVTSVFWGFAHLLNPRANLFAVLNIIVIGLLFAYAYYVTGRLWLPIVLHFAWNFAQGVIFGFPVSGYRLPTSIYQPLVDGPGEITGGLFGPEGGLLALMAVLIGGLLLYGWSRFTRVAPAPEKK
jgi:uncharacterized protein